MKLSDKEWRVLDALCGPPGTTGCLWGRRWTPCGRPPAGAAAPYSPTSPVWRPRAWSPSTRPPPPTATARRCAGRTGPPPSGRACWIGYTRARRASWWPAFVRGRRPHRPGAGGAAPSAGRDGGVRRGQPLVVSLSDPGRVGGGGGAADCQAALSGQALPPVAVWGMGHPGPAGPGARRPAGPHPGARRTGGSGGGPDGRGGAPLLRPHRPLHPGGG